MAKRKFNKDQTGFMVDRWIAEMKEAGLNYDEMLEVFALARQKLLLLNIKNKCNT